MSKPARFAVAAVVLALIVAAGIAISLFTAEPDRGQDRVGLDQVEDDQGYPGDVER